MTDLLIPVILLAIIFAFVAFFYASVGLGGGSSYTALLAIFGASTATIPMVSLTLNIVVTTFGSILFLRQGHARLRLIAPFLLSSIPMAYLGGMLHLPKGFFYALLLLSLSFAVIKIYFPGPAISLSLTKRQQLAVAISCGALLGLIAGITGIGGGVYLVPLIILLGLGSAKEAAACGAFFIWVNSVSGLLARVQFNSIDIVYYVPLVVAVMIGGITGTILGAGHFKSGTMQRILGSILVVAIFLLGRKMFILVV
ncbi:MAG: sulfite exporter TauE/SafE family protein [Desulfobacterales bacterium]|nr:sulfite exporter TauE/SafE family protein [Desulfobacterales bacterium]